jgi:hypothetical protein
VSTCCNRQERTRCQHVAIDRRRQQQKDTWSLGFSAQLVPILTGCVATIVLLDESVTKQHTTQQHARLFSPLALAGGAGVQPGRPCAAELQSTPRHRQTQQRPVPQSCNQRQGTDRHNNALCRRAAINAEAQTDTTTPATSNAELQSTPRHRQTQQRPLPPTQSCNQRQGTADTTTPATSNALARWGVRVLVGFAAVLCKVERRAEHSIQRTVAELSMHTHTHTQYTHTHTHNTHNTQHTQHTE